MDLNDVFDDRVLKSFRESNDHGLFCICFRCEKERKFKHKNNNHVEGEMGKNSKG
jgi:hypothetical protein